MHVPKKDTDRLNKKRPLGKTLESRENQLIELAVKLAEEQLSAGTASSQVITHYLKLGSTKERLEKEKLMKENELLKAKTESLKSQKKIEELYINALNAMRTYSGQEDSNNSYDEHND
jgi:hypothetical protein